MTLARPVGVATALADQIHPAANMFTTTRTRLPRAPAAALARVTMAHAPAGEAVRLHRLRRHPTTP